MSNHQNIRAPKNEKQENLGEILLKKQNTFHRIQSHEFPD